MEKILEILKKYSYTVVIVLVAAFLAVLVIGFNSCGNGDDVSGESSRDKVHNYQEIPLFSKSPENVDSSDDKSYVAYYYTDVSGEQVSEYVAKLEKELGIKFKSEIYPKTASYGEKIIAIHYNVTEKRLSVTIAEKEYNESKNTGE